MTAVCVLFAFVKDLRDIADSSCRLIKNYKTTVTTLKLIRVFGKKLVILLSRIVNEKKL